MRHRLHPDATREHVGHRAAELRHAWRTRSLPHWKLVLGPALVLCLVAGIAPGPWRFVAGVLAGFVIMGWALLRDGHVLRVERWRARHEGHHRTVRALRGAGDWVWLTDPADGPPIVVTGPGGVVLLESVCWSGRVSLVDGVAVRSFADDPDGDIAMVGVSDRMRRLAAERRAQLARAGVRASVRPVLVVWGELADGIVDAAGVTYVRGDLLADWMSGLRSGVRALGAQAPALS